MSTIEGNKYRCYNLISLKGETLMKTLVIIGAGKGLGLSLAKRFGKENFQVALVARTEQKLKEMVDELKAISIEASYYIADITKKDEIERANCRY